MKYPVFKSQNYIQLSSDGGIKQTKLNFLNQNKGIESVKPKYVGALSLYFTIQCTILYIKNQLNKIFCRGYVDNIHNIEY